MEVPARGVETNLRGDAPWVLEATTDFVVLMDREFRITYVNRRVADLNGFTLAEIAGKTQWEVWPTVVGTEIERRYRLAMSTGEPQHFEHRYHEAGGLDLWLEIHAYPGEDGLALFFRDVSDEKRREAQERDDRERLASAMRATDLGVWRCELPLNDYPFFWSPQVRRHFGILEDERVGVKEFLDLLHPDDRQMTAEAMARAIEGRVPYDVTYRTLGRDGKTRWIRATGNAFYREDGTPYRFDGFTVELTERVEREQELSEAKARIEATLQRVAASERRHRLQIELLDGLRGLGSAEAIARAASRIVGRSLGASRTTYAIVDAAAETLHVASGWLDGLADLEGEFGYEAFGRDFIREFERGAPLASSDTEWDPSTRAKYAESFGPLGIRSFLAVPVVRDGVLKGIFSLHQSRPRTWTSDETELLEDVTMRVWDAIERAKAEADLRALNASLDERIRERTADLLRANQEAEAFNYSIAHDLRAPLRAISAASNVLLEDVGERLGTEERAILERQSASAKRLGALIDALLDLSRLSRRPLVRADFDLSALAREVGEAAFEGTSGPAPRLEVASGLRANGDVSLVRLLLQNLLENARKFSPAGGVTRVGGADGTFWVTDEGVGFDMRFAPKIFIPFERLVADGDFPGTGIGLANVDRIVTRHGGRVWVESSPGRGSTFWFTLG